MEESKFMPPHHTKVCVNFGTLSRLKNIFALALNVSPLNKVSFKAFSSSVVSMDNCLLKILEGCIKCKLHKRRKDKPVLGFVNISSHNSCFFLIRIENHYSYPKKVVHIDLQRVRFATVQKHKSVS